MNTQEFQCISHLQVIEVSGETCYLDDDSIAEHQEYIGFYLSMSAGFKPIHINSVFGELVVREYHKENS